MTQQAEPVQDKQPKRPSTVAVRYGYLGWVGQFRHEAGLKFKYSDRVVIKTERGLEIGTPVSTSCAQTCPKFVRPEQTEAYIKCSGEDYLQRGAGEIVRVTTAEDLSEQRRIDAQAKEKMTFCFHAAAKANLDMRMVACEHLLGGERIIFYFTAEGRIDFRQLVRELAREYHTRIEMRQIGARDEARIVADFEICGRECCCKNFLKVLRPVNMKMAKLQKATLDPTKVSGRCGRLRCCLRYEQQTYEDLDANLPDIGVRVRVEQGIGMIRERQVITQLLVLDMGEGRRLAVPLEEIKEILGSDSTGEPRPRRRPREQGDEDGGAPPARRGRRGEDGDVEDRGASRRTAGDEDDESGRTAAMRRGNEDDETPAVAGEGESRAEPPVQGRRPDAPQGRPDPRRGRREGRGGRRGRGDGRDDGRGGSREASGREPGAGRDPGARDGGSREADRREPAGRPVEIRESEAVPPRQDGAGSAAEGLPQESGAAGGPGAAQGTGKQGDGSQGPQQGRAGRRRRRRRRPRSE